MHLYFSTTGTLEDFIFDNHLSLEYLIKFYTNSLRQIFGDFKYTYKFHSIQNEVNKTFNFALKRQDKIIIARLRTGHSKPSKRRRTARVFIFCDCQLTIQHMHVFYSGLTF